jgi:starch synthase
VNAIRKVRKLTDGNGGWVVHSHATCGFALFAMKNFRRFPLVCHVHGTSRSHHVPLTIRGGERDVDYSSISVNYHMIRERLLWGSEDRVLAVSRASCDDLVDAYKIRPQTVRVVYNGVDTGTFRHLPNPVLPPHLESIRGKRLLLFVGHFGLRKGLFYLIRAMKEVRKEFPEAHLLCVGGVPRWLREGDILGLLRHEIEASDLSSNVTLLDAIRNLELVDFYSSAEIFVLPSYYETFSKVCLEAMACELPVIATKTGGLPEAVVDTKTGKLVRYGSSLELASAIIGLLSDKATARAMGHAGRRRVLERFTWNAVAERVDSVYHELESQPKGA